jgi:DeoR family fructose operon transcriptional repressor
MHVDREALIRQHLYANGHSTIQDLADVTQASIATVRRDLQRLEERGVVQRTHGGARMAGGLTVETAFEARAQHNIVAKRAIGAAAYGLLQPRMTVFLDAGTTVLQFARYLRMAPLPLSVFTNSLVVAQLLLGVEDIHVTLLGGQLRPQNHSAVGPLAEAAIDTLWCDLLCLGATAIQSDFTLTTFDPAEASLNARMIRRATRSCVLADSSKFDLTATHRVAPLDAVTDVIADADLPLPWQDRLRRAGVRVTLAENVPEPAHV